jgi:hypothetical protein
MSSREPLADIHDAPVVEAARAQEFRQPQVVEAVAAQDLDQLPVIGCCPHQGRVDVPDHVRQPFKVSGPLLAAPFAGSFRPLREPLPGGIVLEHNEVIHALPVLSADHALRQAAALLFRGGPGEPEQFAHAGCSVDSSKLRYRFQVFIRARCMHFSSLPPAGERSMANMIAYPRLR